MSETRRERENREKRQAERKKDFKLGKASDYIRPFDEIATPGIKTVLYMRGSGPPQKRNLPDQEASCRRQLKRRRATVVAVFREIASGKGFAGRPQFHRAVAAAKEYDAILLAESTSRLIRAADYTYFNQTAWPTVEEFDELRRVADGVVLATLADPDTDPGAERKHQSERGQREKASGQGGRPKDRLPPKERALAMLPVARAMHKRGESLGRIAKKIGVAKATVQGWRRKNFNVYGFSRNSKALKGDPA